MRVCNYVGMTAGLVLAVLSCLLSTSAQAGDTLDRIREAQTIPIAYREASLPFSYLDDAGKPIGHTVEPSQKIAEAVRRELELSQLRIDDVPVMPTTRIPAIVDGRDDPVFRGG